MKPSNYSVYSDDDAYLAQVYEEYGTYLDRIVKREPGRVVVSPWPKKYPKESHKRDRKRK